MTTNREILENFLSSHLDDKSWIIEAGSGRGDRLEYIKKNINPYCCGIEIYDNYVAESKERHHYVLQGDILETLVDIKAGLGGEKHNPVQFIMIDVIEHLTKENAKKVISLMKEMGNKILVFCPSGHCPQEEYDGNPYQKHLSTWTLEELGELAFAGHVVEDFHKGLPEGFSTDVIFAIWEKP